MLDTNTTPNNESYVIVRFTNKTDFDFTPEMGARYNGVPFPLPAGKSLLAPKPVANYLARNLARQVFIKKAPIRDEKETDGKGTDRALWTPEIIDQLKSRFLGGEYEEEKIIPKTEAEIMSAKIAELNKNQPEAPVSSVGYQDKQQVIDELKKREIKFDARQSKSNLEQLLK